MHADAGLSRILGQMSPRPNALYVSRVDDEIIVSLPGYYYTVTYYKPQNSPQLLAKNFPTADDQRIEMTQSDFLAQAWRLANDRARELGWIV